MWLCLSYVLCDYLELTTYFLVYLWLNIQQVHEHMRYYLVSSELRKNSSYSSKRAFFPRFLIVVR